MSEKATYCIPFLTKSSCSNRRGYVSQLRVPKLQKFRMARVPLQLPMSGEFIVSEIGRGGDFFPICLLGAQYRHPYIFFANGLYRRQWTEGIFTYGLSFNILIVSITPKYQVHEYNVSQKGIHAITKLYA